MIFVIAVGSLGGTNFRDANLTDANFTGANLKSSDFRKAILTRTCWRNTRKLDLARIGNSILAKRTVRELLISGNGNKKYYVGANLQGANLAGAELYHANLKEADISQANLQGAILVGANITKIQAIRTDFTNADLTGACLESWNIDSTTKLENVDSKFVYLLEHPKLGTKDDRKRRPSSGEFAPGEFTKLFQEVLNTIDLIFRDGIDWKAFLIAFKEVQVTNEGTEIIIQSIENKGDGVIVIKIKVPDDANKEKLHQELTQNFELALKAIEAKYQAELQGKDDKLEIYRQQAERVFQQNSSLLLVLEKVTGQSTNIYIDNKQDNKTMTNSNDQSRNVNISGGTVNASGAAAFSLGDISGTVANTINQLPDAPNADKPSIKELLIELQAAIEADPALKPEDKIEALEQLKALAEAGSNPKEGVMQKTAKTALTMLKGIISGLPSAATAVEACNKIIPAIALFFGL